MAAATNLATISGVVFDDLNGNDQVEAGEGIADASVRLETSAGAVLQTAQTDSNGNYAFTNLTEGNYVIRQLARTLTSGRRLVEMVSQQTLTADNVAGSIQTQIDSFDTVQTATATMTDVGPVTSQVLASEAIGGQRDLVVTNTAGIGDVEVVRSLLFR